MLDSQYNITLHCECCWNSKNVIERLCSHIHWIGIAEKCQRIWFSENLKNSNFSILQSQSWVICLFDLYPFGLSLLLYMEVVSCGSPIVLFYLYFDLCCLPVSHPQQRPSGHYSSAGCYGATFPAWTGFATECERGSCSCGSEFQLCPLALFLPKTCLKHTLWNGTFILVHFNFHLGQ